MIRPVLTWHLMASWTSASGAEFVNIIGTTPPLRLDYSVLHGQVKADYEMQMTDLIIYLMTLQYHTFNQNVSLYIIEEDCHCKLLHFN